MTKVAIVTDSTACIPAEYLQKYIISVVPLNLIFGHQMFLDGVDITPNQFYKKLVETKISPTTSQPSPDAFMRAYRKYLDEGYDIISIHISSNLSGTVDSATQAKNHLDSQRIEVIDSKSAAMALGYQTLTVARAAVEGASLKECKDLAEKSIHTTNALFTVATLEYLHRGGRIGGATAFLGTKLDLKPILELRDGRIEAITRVRTFNKAIDQMVANLEKQVDHKRPLRLVTMHANALTDAVNLLTRLREKFDITESFVSEISPVLGTHVGPGTVGIAFMAGL
jgi:DegV family protein with EDD domain